MERQDKTSSRRVVPPVRRFQTNAEISSRPVPEDSNAVPDTPPYSLKDVGGANWATPIDFSSLSFLGPPKSDITELLTTRIAEIMSPNVTIKIGERFEFDCHLFLLQSYSIFFAEKTADDSPFVLPEENVSIDAFIIIYKWMQYVGSDSYKLLRANKFLEVFEAAKYLKVEELEEQCWAILSQENLYTEDRAFALFKEAMSRKLINVMEVVLPRVQCFFLPLVASLDFLDLSLEELLVLISSNTISVHSETEVFLSAVRWLLHDWTNRQEHVVEVMEHVRFGLITPVELTNIQRNLAHEELSLVTEYPEVSQMIQSGLHYSLIKSRNCMALVPCGKKIEPLLKEESNQLDAFGLVEPSQRVWLQPYREYKSYEQFLKMLSLIREKYQCFRRNYGHTLPYAVPEGLKLCISQGFTESSEKVLPIMGQESAVSSSSQQTVDKRCMISKKRVSVIGTAKVSHHNSFPFGTYLDIPSGYRLERKSPDLLKMNKIIKKTNNNNRSEHKLNNAGQNIMLSNHSLLDETLFENELNNLPDPIGFTIISKIDKNDHDESPIKTENVKYKSSNVLDMLLSDNYLNKSSECEYKPQNPINSIGKSNYVPLRATEAIKSTTNDVNTESNENNNLQSMVLSNYCPLEVKKFQKQIINIKHPGNTNSAPGTVKTDVFNALIAERNIKTRPNNGILGIVHSDVLPINSSECKPDHSIESAESKNYAPLAATKIIESSINGTHVESKKYDTPKNMVCKPQNSIYSTENENYFPIEATKIVESSTNDTHVESKTYNTPKDIVKSNCSLLEEKLLQNKSINMPVSTSKNSFPGKEKTGTIDSLVGDRNVENKPSNALEMLFSNFLVNVKPEERNEGECPSHSTNCSDSEAVLSKNYIYTSPCKVINDGSKLNNLAYVTSSSNNFHLEKKVFPNDSKNKPGHIDNSRNISTSIGNENNIVSTERKPNNDALGMLFSTFFLMNKPEARNQSTTSIDPTNSVDDVSNMMNKGYIYTSISKSRIVNNTLGSESKSLMESAGNNIVNIPNTKKNLLLIESNSQNTDQNNDENSIEDKDLIKF